MKYFSFLLFLSSLFLFSCTERIDLNIKDSDAVLVVEANITNDAGPYKVKLSKTINFDLPNAFPTVSNAFMVISDDLGNKDTLVESTEKGTYFTQHIQGVEGRTYSLSIDAEGKSYLASCSMPVVVKLDSIFVQAIAGPGGGPGAGPQMTIFNVFQDPAALGNSYQTAQIVNGTMQEDLSLFNDDNVNGNKVTIPYFGQKAKLVPGDSVIMELRSLSKTSYDYYNTLDEISSGGGGGQAASPQNPTTNLSGGALGYFAAYSVSRKGIRIK